MSNPTAADGRDPATKSPSTAKTSLQIGVNGQLGPYHLEEKIGHGGMGAVFKAVHQHLDKVVAIKVLPPHLTVEPEQFEDAHAANARSDLYSLGCTFHFLLTGRPPYATNQASTIMGKLKAHAISPIPDLRVTVPGISPGIASIFQKLMTKAPEDRFQTARELIEALTPYAHARDRP